MKHGLTNLKDYAEAALAKKYYLVKNNQSVLIDRAPCFDINKTPNIDHVLFNKDSSLEGVNKNDLLYHHDITNGSLSIPSLSVGSKSTHGVDGIYFNMPFTIPNYHIGTAENPKNIYHKDGSITLGPPSTKPITDNAGVVDGVNIVMTSNMPGGGGITFPEWDEFLEVDDFTDNAEKPCLRNEKDMTSIKECDRCDEKAFKWRGYEVERLNKCLMHFSGNEKETFFYCLDVDIQYPSDSSNTYILEYKGWTFKGSCNSSNPNGNGCERPNQSAVMDYLYNRIINFTSVDAIDLLISGNTIQCQGESCYGFDYLNDGCWSYNMEHSFYNGSQSPCPNSLDCEPTKVPGVDDSPYVLGQDILEHLNHKTQQYETRGTGAIISAENAGDCFTLFDVPEAEQDCLDSCKNGDSFNITKHWRLTDSGMGCENAYGAKVDIFEDCGCGGTYTTHSLGASKDENQSCGWRALMNR